jgi:hypothetical protein
MIQYQKEANSSPQRTLCSPKRTPRALKTAETQSATKQVFTLAKNLILGSCPKRKAARKKTVK